MKKRHFHIYVLMLSVALALMTGLSVWSIVSSWPATLIILCIVSCIMMIIALWRSASYLPDQVKYFLGCMKFGDTMSRFPDTSDPELAEMYQIMNELMLTYGNTRMELETRRMYYDRILRIMTHELRNSITPIITVSSDMLKREYQPADAREAVEVIHEQSTGIRKFLDSYYELTHLPKPDIKSVDMRALLVGVARLYPKGSVEIRCPQHLVVDCDEMMIKQVVVNLIKNAIEAVGEAKVLSLVADSVAAVEIAASQPDGKVRISVSDCGPGIPADKVEDIFLPFYTSKSDGCGIGLAISRQIMSLHGGTLTCSPGELGGAEFVIQF